MRSRPNEAFRSARRARGFTQAQVAEIAAGLVEQSTGRRCGIDSDYVSKVERGEINWPGAAYRSAFRVLLGAASDAELGLRCPRATDPPLIITRSIVAGEPTWAEDAMLDRELIRFAGAAALGALGAQLPDMLRGALRRTAVPAGVDEHHVEQLRNVLEFFQHSDVLFGGGMSRNAVAGQLGWSCDVLAKSSMSTSVRRSWQSATAHLADVAGFIAFDCGDQLAARRFFLVGLQLAAEAGDIQQRVHILTDAARQAVWLDRPGQGRDLTRLAHADDRHLSPVARAVLATIEARAHGRDADVAEAERAVGQADELFDQRSADPDDPTWIWYYDAAQMTGDAGHALFDAAMRSGDPRIIALAEERLQTAYDLHSVDAARSRAFNIIRIACLAARFGEPVDGLDVAAEAIDGAAPLRSRRIAADLAMLSKTLDPLGRDPALRPRVRELHRRARRVAQAVA